MNRINIIIQKIVVKKMKIAYFTDGLTGNDSRVAKSYLIVIRTTIIVTDERTDHNYRKLLACNKRD